MKSVAAKILVVCLVAFFESCNSIKCYYCNSEMHVNCDKIINDWYLVDCQKNSVCISFMYNNGTNEYVHRGCEPKGTTFELTTCRTNKCNGNDGIFSINNSTVGDRIKCYDCMSLNRMFTEDYNPQCQKIIDDKYLVDCKSGEVCINFKIRNADKTVRYFYRNCGPRDSKIINYLQCNSDRCNGKIKVVAKKNEHNF